MPGGGGVDADFKCIGGAPPAWLPPGGIQQSIPTTPALQPPAVPHPPVRLGGETVALALRMHHRSVVVGQPRRELVLCFKKGGKGEAGWAGQQAAAAPSA